MKHIVCYSGGHSSALVAIEVSRKYPVSDVILLNHDINPKYEDPDIKRFKQEVAKYIGVPITQANILGIEDPEKIPNQFQVCMIAKAFKVNNGMELCTNRLKTAPFMNYLAANHCPEDVIIYYGFDATEHSRIIRRRKILAASGYSSVYPLAEWERTIRSTKELGIEPPLTYATYKHANCKGCLKAGLQHWYVVYCLNPEIYAEAVQTEKYIRHTIHQGKSLEDLTPLFEAMKFAGIEVNEHIPYRRFWASVKKHVQPKVVNGVGAQQSLFMSDKPCECVV